MKFYEDGLIYDTEKAELIAESKIVPCGDRFGYLEHEKLKWYITKNGNFFMLRRPYRKKAIFNKKLVPSGEREFYSRDKYYTTIINELKDYDLIEKANEIADKYLKDA